MEQSQQCLSNCSTQVQFYLYKKYLAAFVLQLDLTSLQLLPRVTLTPNLNGRWISQSQIPWNIL